MCFRNIGLWTKEEENVRRRLGEWTWGKPEWGWEGRGKGIKGGGGEKGRVEQ